MAEQGMEDECFNRCPIYSTCNARTKRCECKEGYEWVGSADAQSGMCRRHVDNTATVPAKSVATSRTSSTSRIRRHRQDDDGDDIDNINPPHHNLLLIGLGVATSLQVSLGLFLCVRFIIHQQYSRRKKTSLSAV
mmetsp:Transcript_21537/g.41147  ORF Transcript_21537/g.41147 Transcript_21537/m.41147 type:complete len:135 (-) Transcript_21537:219-623(-)